MLCEAMSSDASVDAVQKKEKSARKTKKSARSRNKKLAIVTGREQSGATVQR
jgi:hypothetical protein